MKIKNSIFICGVALAVSAGVINAQENSEESAQLPVWMENVYLGGSIGATTSIFGYDEKMEEYLRATGREEIVRYANNIAEHLVSDDAVINNPKDFYDQVIEINLSDLEPHLNGPFTPDRATPISKMHEEAKKNDWPTEVQVGLIGSCTNSSYEDISRSVSIAKQANKLGLSVNAEFTITPGSEQVRQAIERDVFI